MYSRKYIESELLNRDSYRNDGIALLILGTVMISAVVALIISMVSVYISPVIFIMAIPLLIGVGLFFAGLENLGSYRAIDKLVRDRDEFRRNHPFMSQFYPAKQSSE